MSSEVNLVEARTSLGDLVLRAQNGDLTVITRYGKPVAILGPAEAPGESRTIPLAVGYVTVSLDTRPIELHGAERELVFALIDAIKAYEASTREASGSLCRQRSTSRRVPESAG